MTSTCRCVIVDIGGEEILPGTGIIANTPAKSKPHIGKHGWATEDDDGCVRIVLDDGTCLTGGDCWWYDPHAGEPLAH